MLTRFALRSRRGVLYCKRAEHCYNLRMRLSHFFLFFFGTLLLCVIPLSAQGAVFITEIAWMGSDNGGTATQNANDEWIEIQNAGSSEVSLAGWRLAADDGSPDIPLGGAVAPGAFFLLERTDDATVPGITADLIYSGALSNSGELLRLYDAAGSVVEELDFREGWPAGDNATKATMQRSGSQWITATGTPRAANGTPVVQETATADADMPAAGGSGASSDAGGFSSAEEVVKKNIVAAITTTARRAVVGAPFAVGGMGYGLAGEPLKNARYLWSFGDGGLAEGQRVAHIFNIRERTSWCLTSPRESRAPRIELPFSRRAPKLPFLASARRAVLL